jgi:FecR protein
VRRRQVSFAVGMMGCLAAAVPHAFAMPSPVAAERPAIAAETATGSIKLAQATQPPQPSTQSAPADAQPATDEPIGNVATLTGSATVTRNKASTPLKLEDDIFLNDILQTSANSTLGVTFNDATTFNLTANARIEVDNFVYADGGKANAALFNVARGTVAFVAASVAKSGDMKISTPTATLGIRGTTGLVEVPEGATAGGANNVAVKLYPDPDGKVGRIEINDRSGSRLGFLTQGASGFTIRPTVGGGRFTAVPLLISPQQALRDQGFVRQVHAAQNFGRRIVTQRQIQRAQNPARNRANPARQPRLQRQQQPGGPRQPGLRPGTPPRPGQPQQPGLQRQPGLRQPGLQRPPGVPGLQRPGQIRAAPVGRRPAPAPRQKPPPPQR